MSATPPQFPENGPGMDPESGQSTKKGGGTGRAVLIGLVVGVLVFALGLGGVLGARALLSDSSSDDSSASDDPTTSGPTSGPTSGSTTTSSAPVKVQGPIPAGLEKFYRQQITWSGCKKYSGRQCGELEVPLDYEKPTGRTIKLALLKVPAGGKKIGSMVVNPGGPGGSGVQFASMGSLQFGDLANSFDIVGFDPRGVADSTPLKCFDTAQMDALMAGNPSPENLAELKKSLAMIRGLGNACMKADAGLTRHVSTVEVVKDIDVLRGALGERKLDYFGASYGTRIGATYAQLFPQNVGKMVLDGAIDPSLREDELNLQQTEGFETALRAYVASCTSKPNCVLGNNVDQGIQKLKKFLDSLAKKPLKTGSSRELTQGWGMIGVWLPLYAKQLWPALDDALKAAIDNQDGRQLLLLADQYVSRTSSGYKDNSSQVIYAVNCLDTPGSVKPEQIEKYRAKFLAASPTFGGSFVSSLATCGAWPAKSKTPAPTKINGKGAPPIVVIGTTRDPATPLRWARALASQLDSGVLIERDGDGHTGYNMGNSCVDSAVVKYMVRGQAPKNKLQC